MVGSGFYDYDQPVRRLLTTGHLAYLKIAEGCNHRCAFCVIPQIRGKVRSRHPQSLVQEAVSLRTQGVQELLVIAQDTTAYGRDLERVSLASLLEEILAVGFPWVRLLYTYPTSLGEDVLELLSRENTLVKYVDLPYSTSRRVLRAMDRPGDYRSTMELLNTIRRQVRGSLSSSFIVGFQETEEDFAELIKFLEEARLNHVGSSNIHRKKGSKAAAMSDQVPDELKQERYQRPWLFSSVSVEPMRSS